MLKNAYLQRVYDQVLARDPKYDRRELGGRVAQEDEVALRLSQCVQDA